jgi:hypothetical protein
MTTDAEVFGDGQTAAESLSDAGADRAITQVAEFAGGGLAKAAYVALHFLRLREQGKSVDQTLHALAWLVDGYRSERRERLKDAVEGPHVHVSPITGMESRYGSPR